MAVHLGRCQSVRRLALRRNSPRRIWKQRLSFTPLSSSHLAKHRSCRRGAGERFCVGLPLAKASASSAWKRIEVQTGRYPLAPRTEFSVGIDSLLCPCGLNGDDLHWPVRFDLPEYCNPGTRQNDLPDAPRGRLIRSLFDSIKTVATAPIGAHATFVDAIDDKALAFYAAFGFTPLVQRTRPLHPPGATAFSLLSP
jgi:hypothetical protein